MSKKVRILSLDGGGMRGIIPATVLKFVEDKIKVKTQNDNARLADYFDMMVGTSTGGILTCFYNTPNPHNDGPSTKYTADQALDFYAGRGIDIFNNSKRKGWMGMRQLWNATEYDPTTLERILQEEFGDLTMYDLLKPCMVTTYNMRRSSSFFFRSHEDRAKDREFRVWQVLRSTSAAPTYFPPAEIKNLATDEKMTNIDGGVFANNPAMCAYAEARGTKFPGRMDKPSAADMLFLSIGTGGGSLEFPELHKAGKWGVLPWAKSIPNIMMDGSVDTVSYQIRAMFDTLDGDDKKNYKRVDVPVDKRHYDSNMDNADTQNVQKLKDAGFAALEDANRNKSDEHTLDQFIDLLIAAE